MGINLLESAPEVFYFCILQDEEIQNSSIILLEDGTAILLEDSLSIKLE